jgi:hypothetical protein
MAIHRCCLLSALKARPPSSCHTGIRLNRLIIAEKLAMASQISVPVARYTMAHATDAPRPHTGPASPMRASTRGLAGCSFSITSAPKPGMKNGAPAFTPNFRSSQTCPISWMYRHTTHPSPTPQPKRCHAYTA